MGDTLEQRVSAQAQDAVTPLGLLIDDLSIIRAGKRRLVRIAVDDDLSRLEPGDETSPVPPVALDTVADATRAIEAALEAADSMGQAPYVLEVTSPGTSRPLSLPRHFRRNVGRLVTAQRSDGTQLTGRIVAAGPDGLRLGLQPRDTFARTAARSHPTDRNDAGPRFVEYAALTGAQVQVEFNRIDDISDYSEEADGLDRHDEEQED